MNLEEPAGDTIFSFSEDVPTEADRRRSARVATVLRVGTVITESGKELCLIRNMSAGGLMAHVYSPFPVGSRLGFELKSGHRVSGSVLWARGSNIGVGFDAPIDMENILAAQSGEQRARLPRIEVECPALLRSGARLFRASVCDVSQGGVKLECAHSLPLRDVVVTLAGFRAVAGTVRWCGGGTVGVAFNELIPLGELVAWLKERQRGQAAACVPLGRDFSGRPEALAG